MFGWLTRIILRHSWHWGAGNGHGKVAEIVEEGKAEVTSKKVCPWWMASLSFSIDTIPKGNTVSRNARGADDPAVKITRDGVCNLVAFR